MNKLKATPLSSGSRKYSGIWNKLKTTNRCEVITSHRDSATVINGVKKEKAKDKNKPKFKRLDINSEEIPAKELGELSTIKITFKLVDEVSINTI